jgi:hypothetical protein
MLTDLITWLAGDPSHGLAFHLTTTQTAGANPQANVVSYTTGEVGSQDEGPQNRWLFGDGFQYFNDRLNSNHNPFDTNQTDIIQFRLRLPNVLNRKPLLTIILRSYHNTTFDVQADCHSGIVYGFTTTPPITLYALTFRKFQR